MSEAAPEVHAPRPPSGSVKVPGIGPVPKKWFIIVGGGSVVVLGYVYWKRRKSAPAAASTPGASVEGQPCVDANGMPGVYDADGICQVNAGAAGGYYAGSGAQGSSGVTPPVPGTGGFTTNGQWTQQAEADLAGIGIDQVALADALGAYISGRPLTSAQQSLVDQAIAAEGYPPVAGASGYPPAMHTSPTGPGSTPPPTTTPPPSGSHPITVIPTGLHVTNRTAHGVRVAWTRPHIPAGQGPLTGYGAEVYDSKGNHVGAGAAKLPVGHEFLNVGTLKSRTKYHVNVWCDPAKPGGPHATVSFTTK